MSTVSSLNRYRKIIFCLPILTVFISVVTTLTAYAIAENERRNDHPRNCTLKTHFPPYISDVGDCKPQSSVFTFGMVLSGGVTFLIIVIRYLQVRNFYVARDTLNHASLITGAVLIVGKFMVISFQLSSQIIVHYTGAIGYFGGTFIYCSIQAAITWRHSRILFNIRLFCSVSLFLTGFFFGIFLLPSLEKRYKYLNISPAAEWCFAILKMCFMLSFCGDFRNIVPVLDAKHVRKCSYEEVSSNVLEEYESVALPKPVYGLETNI